MNMTEILPLLRVRVGLADDDASKDAQLTVAFNTGVALAESYCDRKFDYKADALEYFTYEADKTISLERYPLKSITSVITSVGQVPAAPPIRFARNTGIVYLQGYANDEDLQIEYAGGYETLPADLLQAFLLIFDNVWKANGGSGGSSATALPSGDIKAISVPDVGRVEFETGSSSSGDTASDWGLVPDMATAILSRMYRREFV